MIISCRLCLSDDPKENLQNVFQCTVQHTEDSLVDVLFWTFSVEIDVTDSFSKNICSECIQLIEYILQVKNTFQTNQKGLRNNLKNQDNDSLQVQSLNNDFEEVSNNVRTHWTTPPSSPSKSKYHSKNIYGSSSPGVRVSLSTIEAMCPMNLRLVRLENTQEYLRYKRLKNGSFKKRKYRHFNLDGALLDDICNSLEDTKSGKTEPMNKEIGVSPGIALMSKQVNPNERILCTCTNNIASLNISKVDVPHKNLINNDIIPQKETDDNVEDHNFLDALGITKNARSPDNEREYDWTTMTFKKDASTNTECTIPEAKNIGITAKVETNTTGTLTKVFKQMKKKDVVKVNVNSLVRFGPKVVLNRLEDMLEQINYKQIDNFTYKTKNGSSESEDIMEILEKNNVEREENEILEEDNIGSETEGSSDQDIDNGELDENQRVATIKKQRYLDYYKNFSSFAVRELIAGKKMRESDSEISPVFKIANVCSVFVCDFCSQSFLSKISLDLHYKNAHKSPKESNDVEVIHKCKRILLKRKRRRRRKFKQLPNENRKNISYAWDRKKLGKYSAISFYRNYLSDEKAPNLQAEVCNIKHKQDVALNQTIQKLANRLDNSNDSPVDLWCDEIDGPINVIQT